MFYLRNVALAVLAIVFVASTAQAGSEVVKSGNFTAVLVAPNQSIAGGAAFCSSLTMCTFTRVPPLMDGDNAQAIVMTVADDNTTVHVRIDLYAAARCEPRGTPDAQAEGDVPLATAGTWIIYNNFSLTTGLTFSQQWSVQNATTATDCGTTVCVNSVAGTAPGDCDAT